MSNNENRIDNSIKLFLAIGQIDDRLVEDARRPYPIFFTVKRTAALVATLILVAIIGIAAIFLAPALAPAKGEDMNASAPDSGSKYLGLGDKAEIDNGSYIELVDKTEHKFSFVLNLTDDVDVINLYVYGYSKKNLPALKPVAATTDAKQPSGYEKIEMPKMLVNGIEANTVPNDEGTYLITLDFSEMHDTYILDRIGISYFETVFNYN